MKIRFGTDGWRGVISREFTFDNARRVVAAIGSYLAEVESDERGVAVGYDRRLLSDHYAREAAGVLAAHGIPVLLAEHYLPTPALSWAVKNLGLAGGIMVTASHNPPEWNGLKFKEAFGGPARVAVTARVEALLDRIPDGSQVPCECLQAARGRGLVRTLDVAESYCERLRSGIDFDAIRRAGLKVAVDSMHGCAAPWLPRMLEEAGCTVLEMRGDWNPGFGGSSPEPVAANLRDLAELVRREGCALGLASDGDADRIGAVDERGRYFSPQRILAVMFRYLRETRTLAGDVARAVSGTSMVDLLAGCYGIEVVETPIGFKHMAQAMLEREILIAGEESGGIGVTAHMLERDGIFNGLLLAEIVACSGKGLRSYLQEIFARIGYFTYDRVDVRCDSEQVAGVRERIAQLGGVSRLAGRQVKSVSTVDGVRLLRDDDSWLLLRPSGTEPLLRVYAEARSEGDLRALLDEGRRLVDA